jgi:PhnB protein
MKLNTYLMFSGQCAEAFHFYERVLGGTLMRMNTWGDSPMAAHAPPGWGEKILHARLEFGDQLLMGADGPPDHFRQPQGFSVSIQASDSDEAERLFTALSEGATITMPIQKTYWSPRFGMLVDRFGIPWMVNCDDPGAHG